MIEEMKKRGVPISDACYQRVSGVPRHLSMVIITHYSFVYKTGDPLPHVKSEEKVPCPYCGGALHCIGSRRRKLILKDGSCRTMVIRRLKCTGCHHIHHELPDCVVPYRRYDEDFIETILSSAGDESSDDCVCEESTIMRIRRLRRRRQLSIH